jgi:hypothetical protein
MVHSEIQDDARVCIHIEGSPLELIVPLDSGSSVDMAVGMIMEIVPLHLVTEVTVPIDGSMLSLEDASRLVVQLRAAGLNVSVTFQGSKAACQINGHHMSVVVP